ncbi:MAG: rubrerythrin family protein [Candidatus Aminicenantes bacterium]|nr:rubrerythrin family protein [Candidatus Aminicenantes bacterium]
MRKMTEENLKNAFAGESQAHMKYLAFAEKAESEKRPNTARLFRANSYAEQVHAVNHLRTLSGIKTTLDNLREAVEGENFEVEEMYPAYISIAVEQGEKGAERATRWALAAEKVHSGFYQKASESVAAGKDADFGAIQVCSVCGWTGEGEAPDTCPVCGSPKTKFKEF